MDCFFQKVFLKRLGKPQFYTAKISINGKFPPSTTSCTIEEDAGKHWSRLWIFLCFNASINENKKKRTQLTNY
jgi:hypothetical protein